MNLREECAADRGERAGRNLAAGFDGSISGVKAAEIGCGGFARAGPDEFGHSKLGVGIKAAGREHTRQGRRGEPALVFVAGETRREG